MPRTVKVRIDRWHGNAWTRGTILRVETDGTTSVKLSDGRYRSFSPLAARRDIKPLGTVVSIYA